MPRANTATSQGASHDQPVVSAPKYKKTATHQTNIKITFLILPKKRSLPPAFFFPFMFYLPLSTLETPEFNHGPSLAGASKESKQIIDFLLF